MKTFHYLPPAPEEQRAFVTQFLGTIVALVLVAAAWFFLHETRARAVMAGVALGSIYLLARAAWALETKAQRAEHAAIALDDDSLHVTDRNRHSRTVRITDIQQCEVRGGKLVVRWLEGKAPQTLEVGARELQDGMTLVRELLAKWSGQPAEPGGFKPPSNFIPLDPQ